MSPRIKVVLAVVVVLAVGAGAGIWWFLRDDAPAKVSLGQGVDAAKHAPAQAAVDDVAGTWTVDTSTGTFDFDSADGTFAGFRIGENLANIGSTTAVGRTGDVTGTLTLTKDQLTAATIKVDLTTIETDRSQRRNKIQQALDTSTFPTATFTLTEPVAFGPDALKGTALKATARGDLTIHGVTHQVSIPIEATLVKNRVVVVGSTDLTFADYDVAVPKSPVVVSADDHGTLEFQLLFTKG